MVLKRRAVKERNVIVATKVLGSRQQVFNDEQELELCKPIKDMEARM